MTLKRCLEEPFEVKTIGPRGFSGSLVVNEVHGDPTRLQIDSGDDSAVLTVAQVQELAHMLDGWLAENGVWRQGWGGR